ncbi:MAG: hypothetical protein ACP5NY_04085 [Thermocladium sp.]
MNRTIPLVIIVMVIVLFMSIIGVFASPATLNMIHAFAYAVLILAFGLLILSLVLWLGDAVRRLP